MRKWMDIVGNCLAETNENFRAWFGNSKVVNDDGSPRVVYHGSNAHAYSPGEEIDVFNTSPPSGRGAAFFTSSPQLAREYGEKVYSVYLRIEHPLIVYGDGKSWTSLDSATRLGGRVSDALRAHHHKQAQELSDIFAELSDMDGEEPTTWTPQSKIPDDTENLDRFNLGILPGMEERQGISTDVVVKEARRLGYDGVIFKDVNDSPTHDRNIYQNSPTDIYAVFHPGQVKSSNNGGQFSRTEYHIEK